MSERVKIPCSICQLKAWHRLDSNAEPICPPCRRGEQPEHGTTGTYRRGCRCDECRSAAAAYLRTRGRARRAAGLSEQRGTVSRQCERCGTGYTTRRHVNASRYCSDYCRRGGPSPRWRRAQDKLTAAATGSRGYRVIISGYCLTCGNAYTQRATSHSNVRSSQRCCSTSCHLTHIGKVARATRLRGKSRRRARQHGAFVADVDHLKVFEADGWKCHLCGKTIRQDLPPHHRMGPTIDHIVPISRGGTHEPSNVRAAHRKCNSSKCAGGGGEQFALFV